MASICQAKSLDHLVLTVQDIDATVDFYRDVLGMKYTSFISASPPGVTRHALLFGEQKINLYQSGQVFEPKAQMVHPGSSDMCFLVEDDVEEVLQRLKQKNIKVLGGGQVVQRTGARTKLLSVYIHDPDGNLVE